MGWYFYCHYVLIIQQPEIKKKKLPIFNVHSIGSSYIFRFLPIYLNSILLLGILNIFESHLPKSSLSLPSCCPFKAHLDTGPSFPNNPCCRHHRQEDVTWHLTRRCYKVPRQQTFCLLDYNNHTNIIKII